MFKNGEWLTIGKISDLPLRRLLEQTEFLQGGTAVDHLLGNLNTVAHGIGKTGAG
jgi:hypothetical protein